MSLLFAFVQSFSEEEQRTAQQLALPKKEQLLFESFMAEKREPEKEELLRLLQTTDANLRKTQSQLLEKLYAALVPAGGEKLLRYLHLKGTLRPNLYAAMRTSEKSFGMGQEVERWSYYRMCVDCLTGVSPTVFQKELLEEFSAKFLAATPKKLLPFSRHFLLSRHIYTLYQKMVWQEKINEDTVQQELRAQLSVLHNQAQKLATPEAWFYYHNVCVFIPPESDAPADMMQHARHALHFATQGSEYILPHHVKNVRLYYCGLLHNAGEHEASYQNYVQHFRDYPEDLKLLPVIEHFVRVMLTIEHFSEAKEFMDAHFLHFTEGQNVQMDVRTAVTYAYYFLLTGKEESAWPKIQHAKALNPKLQLVRLEWQIRFQEAMYFALAKNFEQALHECAVHLKWLQSKGLTLDVVETSEVFILLRELVEAQFMKTALPAKYQALLPKWTSGANALMGQLLLKVAKQ